MTDETPTAPAADAPYGVRTDGTPRRKPGRPPKPGAARKPPARGRATDYRPGILGLAQVVAFPLTVAGRYRPPLALDGAAVATHAPDIAEALSVLAAERPEVAAALDRVLSAGPYGLLIGACVPLVAQIGVNHRRLPESVGVGLGAVPREQLAARLVERAGDADAAAATH
jgi:hypothetical protein